MAIVMVEPATEKHLLDNSPEARTHDVSGTPVGLINASIRRGEVAIFTEFPADLEDEVVVEFPFGAVWMQQSGFKRFVRFYELLDDQFRYGLVRASR